MTSLIVIEYSQKISTKKNQHWSNDNSKNCYIKIENLNIEELFSEHKAYPLKI